MKGDCEVNSFAMLRSRKTISIGCINLECHKRSVRWPESKRAHVAQKTENNKIVRQVSDTEDGTNLGRPQLAAPTKDKKNRIPISKKPTESVIDRRSR